MQKNQKFKVILNYTASSGPAWVTCDTAVNMEEKETMTTRTEMKTKKKGCFI